MNRMIRWMIVGAVMLFAGCISSGPLGPAPVVDGPVARVVFIRPVVFIGALATVAVAIDGRELYGLDSGQHVAFAVAPGEHIVGVRMPDSAGLGGQVRLTATIAAEAGRDYYFRVGPGEFARLADVEGRVLMIEDSKPALPTRR